MLQLAHATATLVNNGIQHKPRLVMATRDTVTGEMHPVPPDPPVDLGYKPQNVAAVRNALVSVTQGGTATKVFAGAGYTSGGKPAPRRPCPSARKTNTTRPGWKSTSVTTRCISLLRRLTTRKLRWP